MTKTATKKATKADTFEPNILAFVCNWCAYGASESAGLTSQEYPANVKMVRVMCSGRVERKMLFEAIQKGIDGIIVIACNIGNCHYMDGNIHAKTRIDATKSLMTGLGINAQRIQFQEIRASEGDILAKKLTEFVETIKNLGPNQ